MTRMPLYSCPRQRQVPIGVDFGSAEWELSDTPGGMPESEMGTETNISDDNVGVGEENSASLLNGRVRFPLSSIFREAYEGALRNYIEVTGIDGSEPNIDDISLINDRIVLGKVYVRTYMAAPRYSYRAERTHYKTLEQYGTLLPTWLLGIMPKYHSVSGLVASSSIVGSMSNVRAVTLGQVSCEVSNLVTLVGFNSTEWERIESWGMRSCMTSHVSIIRTACMIGLGLPQGYEGVINAPWEFFPSDYARKDKRKLSLGYCDALLLFCGMGCDKRLHKRQFDSLHACYMMYAAGASIEACLSRFIRQLLPNDRPPVGIMRIIYDFNGDSVVLENALSHMARLLEAFTYGFWYSQFTARARSRLHMRKAYANNV